MNAFVLSVTFVMWLNSRSVNITVKPNIVTKKGDLRLMVQCDDLSSHVNGSLSPTFVTKSRPAIETYLGAECE